jgi:hypothetical protein
VTWKNVVLTPVSVTGTSAEFEPLKLEPLWVPEPVGRGGAVELEPMELGPLELGPLDPRPLPNRAWNLAWSRLTRPAMPPVELIWVTVRNEIGLWGILVAGLSRPFT